MEFESSAALNRHVAAIAENEGHVLLSFSCGKDSIAAWLYLREFFAPEKIHPFYMWFHPNLEFVENSLRYYEDFFGRHILRLPHPFTYYWLRTFTFQPPENRGPIADADLIDFDQDDVTDVTLAVLDLPPNTHTAIGVRAVDSLNRWASVKKYGPLNESRRTFYPIYDFRKEDLMGIIRKHNCKLPVDYRIWGRSFDGIDYRFVGPLKQYFPEDYARLQELFPFIDLEVLRIEIRNRYYD